MDQPKNPPDNDGSLELHSTSLRHQLARYAHEAWSGWMQYMFSKGLKEADGTYLMPAWAVERWTRQMETDYRELPASERESDLAEADKMLAILRANINYDEPVVVITVFDGTKVHRQRVVLHKDQIPAVQGDSGKALVEILARHAGSELRLATRVFKRETNDK